MEVRDEPTAFLDGESAQRVRELVVERARQRLVLISTHDQELIQLASHVWQLQLSDQAMAQRQHHA